VDALKWWCNGNMAGAKFPVATIRLGHHVSARIQQALDQLTRGGYMSTPVITKPAKAVGEGAGTPASAAASLSSPVSARQYPFHILLTTSPKGGVGKTGCSRNLAVAAAKSGKRVALLDLDPQKSLSRWWQKRPDEGVEQIDLYSGSMTDLEETLAGVEGVDLLVVDTPTSVEEYPDEIKRLIMVADFVLVPTGHTNDDLESVCPWMKMIRTYGRPAAFLLNKANRRTKSFRHAQTDLMSVGKLVPIEIPALEDIHTAAKVGLSVIDVEDMGGAAEFTAAWKHISLEMDL
jgi:chromosome partitioning protein